MVTEGPFLNVSDVTTATPPEHPSGPDEAPHGPGGTPSSVPCGLPGLLQGLAPSVAEIVAANDVASRANYCYMFCAVLGFSSGLFLCYSFCRAYRARRNWSWLDGLLSALCASEFLVLLCSLSSLAHRPDCLNVSDPLCALLSFLFNAGFFGGQLLLVLVGVFLMLERDSLVSGSPLLQRARDSPGACVAVTAALSLLCSALLAALAGAREKPPDAGGCRLDPRREGGAYEAAKLVLGFVLPNLLLLALLAAGCALWRRPGGGAGGRCFLSRLAAFPAFLAAALVTFVCRLFYAVVLARRAGEPSRPGREALMSVAEFVLFSGSCGSLALVLLLHPPCRESLQAAARGLAEFCCCRRGGARGGGDTGRRDMVPRAEIADTQRSDDL